MIKSFKEYIARTGSKSMKGKKLIRKNKKVQTDLISKEAQAMAVATKIGGIKPVNYISAALTPKRRRDLSQAIGASMSAGIRKTITISI
jgi:hypothetical protein